MARKLLLENAHIEGIHTFEVYRKHGGYRSVEKALKTMWPEDIVEEVKKSGLRGRGGAGWGRSYPPAIPAVRRRGCHRPQAQRLRLGNVRPAPD